jgi:pimeloyl-ACP methyl ester carboxylesterase
MQAVMQQGQLCKPGDNIASIERSRVVCIFKSKGEVMQQVSSFRSGAIRRKYARKGLGFIGCLLLVTLMCAPGTVMAMEYGTRGPYNVIRETIQNPMSGDDVTVFLPQNAQSSVPVMFFSHGNGGNYYQAYKSLCTHVASQGVAVVFSPYPSGVAWSKQYDILWNGFQEAADVYRYEFDLDSVGFFGHSWGGGATPNMALRGIDKGWGKIGMLMFIMAPGPANGVSDSQLQSLKNGSLIVQTFEDDSIVPEQLAQGIYDKVGISSANKAYYYVLGGDHTEPSERIVNDYDSLAIWTPLDALMDHAFKLDTPSAGKSFALDGTGDHWSTIIVPDEGEEPPAEEPRWPDGENRWWRR